jgi:hypothetical protein
MWRILAVLAVLAAVVVAVIPARAEILPVELRGGVGIAGIGDAGGLFDPARLREANVELLYSIPHVSDLALLGEIRPHLGATYSFSGREHMVYGGLSYTFQVPLVPLFAEASLGGAWQSGALEPVGTPREFGCAALGRASGSIGFNVLPGASLIGTVAHVTDFGACNTPAKGRTDVMVRLGIRF